MSPRGVISGRTIFWIALVAALLGGLILVNVKGRPPDPDDLPDPPPAGAPAH